MIEQLKPAVELAMTWHEGQVYGDSTLPYTYHLIKVDRLVIHAFAPKDREHHEAYSKEPGDEIDLLRSLAWLHDIVEDTDITDQDMINVGICQELINAVHAISKVEGESYKDYIEKVMSNPLALKVKMADTATNLSHSIVDGNDKRIAKYSKQLDILTGFEPNE